MSLPPLDWADDTLAGVVSGAEILPEWEDPEQPTLTAFLATLGRVLWQPRRFFDHLPSTGGLGEPLGFALLVGTTGLLSSFFWQLVMDGGFSETIPAGLSRHLGAFMSDPKVIVGVFLLAPLLVALGQFFLSVCLMWAVRLTGPGDATFEGVFRIAAYAQAPVVAGLIPWGGTFIAGAWNLILIIIGLSRTYGFSTFKALFALVLATVFQGMLFSLFFLLLGALGLWHIFLA